MGAQHHIGRPLAIIAAFTLLYAAGSMLVTSQYYQLMLTLVPIWAAMGLSWNILSGYSGLISFGHAAFFGLGAYTVTLMLVHWGVTPWIGIPAAMVVGAVAALLIGYPTFRLRGHYFALSMLAYPLALLYLFEWLGLPGGRAADEARSAGGVHAVQRLPRVHRGRAGAAGRSRCWFRSRSSARASAWRSPRSSRTSPRRRRPASTRCAGRCARSC